MRVIREGEEFLLYKEKLLVGRCGCTRQNEVVGRCGCTRQNEGWRLGPLWVDPVWRHKGYGSFLLRQVLKATGGYAGESLHLLELPNGDAEKALAKKFGFAPAGNLWRRHRVPDPTAVGLTHDFLRQNLLPGGFFVDATRVPDPTAVGLTHDFLRQNLLPGGFFVDATCGNGGDTEFLCRLAGPEGV